MIAFFATAARGTEVALRDELRELRFRGVRADRGGVHFEGGLDDGYRACLELRCAVRVLAEVCRFDAPDEDALYDGVRKVDWSQWLDPRRTLAIRAHCRSSRLTHTQYVAQRAKDAIVDGQRDRLGARSSVDLDDPDVLVSIHLVRDEATVYLDFSGRPLHLRGYRRSVLEAPIKETLAASLLRLAGYRGEVPFVDPMCGSGTIAIEAALVAANVAPGLLGGRFGFERWASFDATEAEAWKKLRERALSRRRADHAPIIARDISGEALAAARDNAERAGVSVTIERASITTLRPEPRSFVVTNPPYGERISMPPEVERAMGRTLSGATESTVGVLAHGPSILSALGRRPDRSFEVYNGDLECRFALFDARLRTP